MLKYGVELLYQVLSPLGYDAVSLLSCMKLNEENMPSIVQHKTPLCTVLEYTRNVGNAVKESLKKTTVWSACILFHKSEGMHGTRFQIVYCHLLMYHSWNHSPLRQLLHTMLNVWGSGHMHMVQPYGSALLGRKQPWQGLARFPISSTKDQLKLDRLFRSKKGTICALSKKRTLL